MDVIIPVQPIVKFHYIAARIKLIKEGKITCQVVSSELINMSSQLPTQKAALLSRVVDRAFRLYLEHPPLVDTTELIQGAKSVEFQVAVMNSARQLSLCDASRDILRRNEAEVEQVAKPLGNITMASQCFVPAYVRALLAHHGSTELYSDYNFQFDGVAAHTHIHIAPLKQNPRNVPEEAASYILVGDRIDTVYKKITKGFCEDRNTEYNPVLDQFKIVFCFLDEVTISGCAYTTVAAIARDFGDGKIDPKTLKEAATGCFRQFWKEDEELKAMCEELLKKK